MTILVIFEDKSTQYIKDVVTFQHIGTKLEYYTNTNFGHFTVLKGVIGVVVGGGIDE